MRRIIKRIIKAVTCPKCGKSFPDKNELAYHMYYDH